MTARDKGKEKYFDTLGEVKEDEKPGGGRNKGFIEARSSGTGVEKRPVIDFILD